MSDLEVRKPRFENEGNAKQSVNLSALAVRERSITLFFLLAMVIAGAVCLFRAWPRRRSGLHDQGLYGDGGMAGRNRAGDAGAGSGAAGKADAGAYLLRPCGHIYEAGSRVSNSNAEGLHAP